MAMSREMNNLAAQCLALQAVVVQFGRHLADVSPEFSVALGKAFDEATRKVEEAGLALGDTVIPEYTLKACEIVKDMRTGVFGGKG